MPKLVEPIYEFSGTLILHPAADISQRGKRLSRPFPETRSFLKNSSKQVDDNWDVDYDSYGVNPDSIVDYVAHAGAKSVT